MQQIEYTLRVGPLEAIVPNGIMLDTVVRDAMNRWPDLPISITVSAVQGNDGGPDAEDLAPEFCRDSH